jgi:hypothetical protein
MKHSEETKRKISENLKKKWASGTRKANPPGYGKKISKALLATYAAGNVVLPPRDPEQCRINRMKRDPNEVAETNKRLGKERFGHEMKSPICKRGVNNWAAKYWSFTNKSLGKTIAGMNLTQLVRDNQDLFRAFDLNWSRMENRCRATSGLRSLHGINQRTGKPYASIWKGWVIT